METLARSIARLFSGRRVFVSHAREDAKLAERIALALRGRGCTVFLDENDLPPGGNYETRIHAAIKSSSVFVFLISPASVTPGRYPMTELKFANDKWAHPAGHVLPVPAAETPFESVPEYLRAATIMKVQGDAAAEVAAAVDAMLPRRGRLIGALGAAGALAAASVAAFISLKQPATFITPSDPETGAPAESRTIHPKSVRAETDNWPPTLSLKFSLDPAMVDDPSLYKDQVALSVLTPPSDRTLHFVPLYADGFYEFPNIVTPGEHTPFHAWVSRRVKDSYRGTTPNTSICLHRAKTPPKDKVPHQTLLRCKEGDQPCTALDPTDPGWLAAENVCGRKAALRDPAGQRWRDRFAAIFTNEATAAAAPRVWTVPSLETLNEQKAKDQLRDGFTVFTIEAVDKLNIDADAISLDLRVDDTPVLIEGLPSEMQRRSFKPDQPLELKFALQNLDFDGRYAGCDRIEARLQLYKDGASVGAPILLPFHYAALRDVERTEIATDQGKFRWSAGYTLARPRDAQGRTQEEWRVFLTSENRKNLDRLQTMRQDIDRLGLTLNRGGRDYPVVAVVRPPLRTDAFGLALGIVQPTGQIQFTFGKTEAAELLASAKDMRARNPAARPLIAESANMYLEPPNIDRRYACTPPR